MPFRSDLKAAYILAFFLAATPAYSQEKEASKQETKNTPQSEYYDVQARLQVLKSKVKSRNENVRKLVQDKQAARTEKEALAIVKNLKVEYSELQRTIREYEEQRNLMNYRFPEKGRSEKPTYQRIESKSLDQMESEFSIEGKVKKAVTRLRTVYPPPPVEKKQVQQAPPDPLAPPKDPSRTSVTESQVLSK
jgi:hypothetical protein